MTDIFPILSVLRILDRIGCHYHHDLRDGTQRSIFNMALLLGVQSRHLVDRVQDESVWL